MLLDFWWCLKEGPEFWPLHGYIAVEWKEVDDLSEIEALNHRYLKDYYIGNSIKQYIKNHL